MQSEFGHNVAVLIEREQSANTFARHVIHWTVRDDDKGVLVAKFAEPGTNIFSFTVCFAPGMIAVSGDCGELVVCPRDGASAVKWFLSIIDKDNLNYLAGKISQDVDAFVFNICEALAWIRDAAEASKKEREKWGDEALSPDEAAILVFDERYDLDELQESDFYSVLSDAGVDDPPDFRSLSHGAILIIVGLRAFAKALRAAE